MPSTPPRTYTLDSETLKLNAYRLLCLFFANKEIARLSDPNEPHDAAVGLERRFFSREMTQLLLSIATGLRVLNDQMCALPLDSEYRAAYLARRDEVNRRHRCMMFDEMSLRDVCSKIIHALVVEPHFTEGSGSHQVDEYNWMAWSEVHDLSSEDAGPEPKHIRWEHLSGHVRLGGRRGKELWWQLLEVPIFVEAVSALLDPSD